MNTLASHIVGQANCGCTYHAEQGIPCNHDMSLLSRDECIELLQGIGIQCYDHETVEVLREAVKVNMLDGSL